MEKSHRKKSSEEIENEILIKEYLDAGDYDFRRNNVSEEPIYTLFVTIGENKDSFECICKIELALVENFTDLYLDFKGELQRIWVNRELTYYNHENPDHSSIYNGSVLVIPRKQLRPHLNSIIIEYRCLFMSESKGLFVGNKEAETSRLYYTLAEPNNTSLFMPIIGQLNVKGSFKLYVNHPPNLTAISNNSAKHVKQLNDDEFFQDLLDRFEGVSKYYFWSKLRIKYFETEYRVTEFHSTGIICVSMFTFAVGCLSVVQQPIQLDPQRSITLGFYCQEKWKFDLEHFSQLVARLLQYAIIKLEKITAKQFPYQKYDALFVPDFHLDATETPGIVIMYEEFIKFKDLHVVQQFNILKTFMHEIIHMWFGNLVSINWWSDLWIKEGLTEYLSHLFLSELETSPDNDFVPGHILKQTWTIFNHKAQESFDFELQTVITLNPVIENTQGLLKYYNPVPYQKGAMFFRTLSCLIGIKSFKSILRKMTDFYSHHNVSTSIMYNLIKVMIRTIDEDDVCLINEQLFEKFWFDSVLIPLYSGIRVTHFSYNSTTKVVKVHFEPCDADLGFDQSIYHRFLKNSPQRDSMVDEGQTNSPSKQIFEFHSSDELSINKIPLETAINQKNIRGRHFFLQVMMLNKDLDIISENWCRICLTDDKSLEIPGIEQDPQAVLLNPRFESYCRVIYDKDTLGYLVDQQRLPKLQDNQIKLSVYLSALLASSDPGLQTVTKHLGACLAQEDEVLQKLLGDKIQVPQT